MTGGENSDLANKQDNLTPTGPLSIDSQGNLNTTWDANSISPLSNTSGITTIANGNDALQISLNDNYSFQDLKIKNGSTIKSLTQDANGDLAWDNLPLQTQLAPSTWVCGKESGKLSMGSEP